MLFVSPHSNLRIPLKSERPITAVDNANNLVVIGKTRRLFAQFTYGGGIPEYAMEKAQEVFGERLTAGLPEGVPWNLRVGWFDTVGAEANWGWTTEEREEAERLLLNHPSHGTAFLLVERPKTVKPWPKYDNLETVEEIMARVVEDGYDPKHVVEYERENRNREDVVRALENYVEETAESEVVA